MAPAYQRPARPVLPSGSSGVAGRCLFVQVSFLGGAEGIGAADPDLTTKDHVPVLPTLHWRSAMSGLSCPNDGSLMESDAPATTRERARRRGCACTHTCPECGYIEIR